jgi:DNA-binding transcriptional ArsR family regulator
LQPDRCAELLRALAAPDRLRIVRALRQGPHKVSEMADRLKAPLANVSHHLNVLHDAGLVQRRKQGRAVLYALAESVLQAGAPDEPFHLDLGCCRLEVPPFAGGPS